MFENLTVIAVIVTVLWLAGYGLYLYASGQHTNLYQEVETLKRELERPQK